MLTVLIVQKSTSSSNGVQQGATSKEHNPRKSSKRKNRWLWRHSGTKKQEKRTLNDDTKTQVPFCRHFFNGFRFDFCQFETKSNQFSNDQLLKVAKFSRR